MAKGESPNPLTFCHIIYYYGCKITKKTRNYQSPHVGIFTRQAFSATSHYLKMVTYLHFSYHQYPKTTIKKIYQNLSIVSLFGYKYLCKRKKITIS